ncbi:MAG TPA: hypothetical protein ACFYEM_08610 [Candidatus Hypogeohydataceae bacterium YC40]
MNVLFLRFLDRVLNMVDEPIVLFDKELNPVRANAPGWRFFDSCKKEPSFLCEGCPVRQTKEAGLPRAKRCSLGIVQSEPLLNADGVLDGVVVTLLGSEDGQKREYKLEEIDWDLTEA